MEITKKDPFSPPSTPTEGFFAKVEGNAQKPAGETISPSPTPQSVPFPVPPIQNEAGFTPSVPPSKLNLKKIILFLFGGLIFILIVFFIFKKGLLKPVKKNGETNLVYWGLWEPESVMAEIISEYQNSHPKIKINYVLQSPKDYRERLQTAIMKGSGPDIFRFHNTWVQMLKDYLAPIPSTVMDSATFEKIFYPVAKNDLRLGSNYIGIPLEIDNLALFYNEEIFSIAGKLPPTTWDEFRKTALELTVRDAAGKIQTAGAALGVTSNVDHWSDILGLMFLQNGANLEKPTDNLAEDALTFFTLFSRFDRVWDETLPSSTYFFASGRLAMYFGPSWRFFEIKALNPKLKFKIIPVPQLPGVNITWASYWVEGVNNKSGNVTEAWEFLKYLSSKQTMEKLYQAQSKLRFFGEPYSRTDMADLLKNEPYVGVFVEQAPKAKSWYLSSRTFDNGINDKIIKYYEDAVNAVNKGAGPKEALATVAQGVAQVLSQYGAK